MSERREAAIKAAARAFHEAARHVDDTMPGWSHAGPLAHKVARSLVAPSVDAVLALGCEHGEGICGDRGPDLPPGSTARGVCVLRAGHAGWHHGHDGSDWSHGDKRSCDCAERLEVEAERVWRRFGSSALDAVNAYGDAAAFLRASEPGPAGVNVTAAASTHPPPPSEGRPMTGAPLDADEAAPAPAGPSAANDSSGIPPEPPPDARGSDLTASEGGEAVREVRESAGLTESRRGSSLETSPDWAGPVRWTDAW